MLVEVYFSIFLSMPCKSFSLKAHNLAGKYLLFCLSTQGQRLPRCARQSLNPGALRLPAWYHDHSATATPKIKVWYLFKINNSFHHLIWGERHDNEIHLSKTYHFLCKYLFTFKLKMPQLFIQVGQHPLRSLVKKQGISHGSIIRKEEQGGSSGDLIQTLRIIFNCKAS